MKEIKFYKLKDPYGFMSNFYSSKIIIYGKTWENVEAPYQSQKTLIQDEIDQIHSSKSAKESKLLGQKVTMREDWDDIKAVVMYECVFAKFDQNFQLHKELYETGDAYLIEDSPVDSYWGCGADGLGKNMLGKILMRVRKLYKEKFYVTAR